MVLSVTLSLASSLRNSSSEERQKRTGNHTFQIDRKALPLPKGLNISRIEKNSDTGKVI